VHHRKHLRRPQAVFHLLRARCQAPHRAALRYDCSIASRNTGCTSLLEVSVPSILYHMLLCAGEPAPGASVNFSAGLMTLRRHASATELPVICSAVPPTILTGTRLSRRQNLPSRRPATSRCRQARPPRQPRSLLRRSARYG